MASFYFGPWVTFVAGIYLMCIAGSIYLFPVYSGSLKTIFGYNSKEINSVGTAANVGML
jgi:hypothetical protein